MIKIVIVFRNATIVIAFVLVLVAAYLTAAYSARLMVGCFLSAPHIHPLFFADTTYSNTIRVTLLLSIGAAVFGYVANDLFLFSSYRGALFVQPDNLLLLDSLPYSAGFPLLILLIFYLTSYRSLLELLSGWRYRNFWVVPIPSAATQRYSQRSGCSPTLG
jgi:hypothetical protein